MREVGYYWCKKNDSDKWVIYFYEDQTFCTMGTEYVMTYWDHEMFAINETRIINPDENA